LPDRFQDNEIKDSSDVKAMFKTGWIYHSLISNKYVAHLSEFDKMERKRKIKVADRRKTFVNNHPNIKERFKKDILNGSIQIGMSKSMVRASWGAPDDINRTVTVNTTSEQWVYGSLSDATYVYFTNGIMTSFQD